MSIRGLISGALCLWIAAPALAAPGESSFTPTSLLVPLASVVLLGPNNGGAELYRCPSATPNADMDLDDADGDEININAFFTLQNIAWATLSGNGPGGCTHDDANTQSVCTSYPIPVTYVGTTSPTLDTFYITEDQADLTATKAGGQLLLLEDRARCPSSSTFGSRPSCPRPTLERCSGPTDCRTSPTAPSFSCTRLRCVDTN